MNKTRSVIFILDGAPMEGSCRLTECFEKATGVYAVVDDLTEETLGSIQLCKKHGAMLATGPSA